MSTSTRVSFGIRLYKALYVYLVSKAVAFNIRYERNEALREIHGTYFTRKLLSYIDPACIEIDKRHPWLTLTILTYLILLAGALALPFVELDHSKSMIQPSLALIGLLVVVHTLRTSSKSFFKLIADPSQQHPADIIAFHVPVLMIQMIMGSTLFITAGFMSLTTIFSGLLLSVFAVFNQYNMVCQLITNIEKKELSPEEIGEYLAMTGAFYSNATRGEILSCSMDGERYTLNSLSTIRDLA